MVYLSFTLFVALFYLSYLTFLALTVIFWKNNYVRYSKKLIHVLGKNWMLIKITYIYWQLCTCFPLNDFLAYQFSQYLVSQKSNTFCHIVHVNTITWRVFFNWTYLFPNIITRALSSWIAHLNKHTKTFTYITPKI